MDEKAFAVVTVPNAHVSSRTNQYLPVIYLPQAAGIAVSAVFLALLLRWTDHNRPLTDPQIAVAVVCTALLFFCKVVYAAEALLVLCLPDRVLPVRRKLAYSAVSALVTVPLYAFWANRFMGMLAIVNVHDNLAYAAGHPGSVIALLLWNVAITIPRVIRQSFLVAPLTAGAATLGAATAVVITCHGRRARGAPSVSVGRRGVGTYRYLLAAVVIVVVVLVLVCVPLLLTWNDLSTMRVPSSMDGIQGRYLLPLLPLLLCLEMPAPASGGLQTSDGIRPPVDATARRGASSSAPARIATHAQGHFEEPDGSSLTRQALPRA